MSWLKYFEENRDHRHPIPWEQGIIVEPHLRLPLIRSLQRFQVGESGEGRHLKQSAKATNDPAYQASIDLFIREEQEHARLMACILKSLGAGLIQKHWSDACFVLLRRLFGLKHELLILLLPEMIAKRYFRALRDGTRDPVLRAVFNQILHDEEGHVAFHIDYLQRALATLSLPARVMVHGIWRVLFQVTCLVVILDHRAVLRATGVSLAAFWWDCNLIFEEVSARILSTAPTPVPVNLVSEPVAK